MKSQINFFAQTRRAKTVKILIATKYHKKNFVFCCEIKQAEDIK